MFSLDHDELKFMQRDVMYSISLGEFLRKREAVFLSFL